jgi:hypothetical protein
MTRVTKSGLSDWTAIVHIADTLEEDMRSAFLMALSEMANRVDLGKLANALQMGNLLEAVQLTVPALGDLSSPIVAVFQDAFSAIGARYRPELRFGFDLLNPRSVSWIEGHAAERVVAISNDTRAAVQGIVLRGFREGWDVPTMARRIKRTVGLFPRWANAVTNYHARLVEQGNRSADRLADEYRQRLVAKRATMIARTETIAASNMGQVELWLQAIDAGQLPTTARKVWVVTPDEKLCPRCRPLDGVTVSILEMFQPRQRAVFIDDGSGYPSIELRLEPKPSEPVLAPPLHPNCRCALRLAFD